MFGDRSMLSLFSPFTTSTSVASSLFTYIQVRMKKTMCQIIAYSTSVLHSSYNDRQSSLDVTFYGHYAFHMTVPSLFNLSNDCGHCATDSYSTAVRYPTGICPSRVFRVLISCQCSRTSSYSPKLAKHIWLAHLYRGSPTSRRRKSHSCIARLGKQRICHPFAGAPTKA